MPPSQAADSTTGNESGSGQGFDLTQSLIELEAAGYNSMGFSIEYQEVCCVECDQTHLPDAVKVGGMIRYETPTGERHVFALGCPSCDAKGLLFAGPEMRAGGSGDVVKSLAGRARHTDS
jgi:hypothetical protein